MARIRYGLVAYCSNSYFDAMRQSIHNWHNSDADEIYIYGDHPYAEETVGRIFFTPNFEPSNDFGTNCARKAEVLLHYMSHAVDIQRVVLLDIDCGIVAPLKPIFDVDFDIGVTVYPEIKEKKQLNNISAGALFLNNTPEVRSFISEWLAEQNKMDTPSRDQASLSKIVKRWDSENDAIIRKMNCDIFNHHPRTNQPFHINEFLGRINRLKDEMKVIHFSNGTWKEYIKKAEFALGRSI